MQTALLAIPTLTLIVVLVSRARMVRSSGTSRALWLSMAFLAVALSLNVLSVYDGFSHLLGTPVGGELVKLWCGLGAAVGVRVLATSLLPEGRSSVGEWVVAGAAALAIAVPLLVSPPKDLSPLLVHTTDFYDNTWRSWALWLPFLMYLSWALATAIAICWRHGRRSPAYNALRKGLALIGVGCLVGMGYVVFKLVLLAAWHTGFATAGWDKTAQTAQASLLLGTAMLIGIGSSWGALGRSVGRLREAVWAQRSCWSLAPLWHAIAGSYPEIILGAGRSPWQPKLRLLRRVIEIRDGLLILEVGDEQDEKADADFDTKGTIAAALYQARDLESDPMSGELHEEVRWLTIVTREYRRQAKLLQRNLTAARPA